MDQSEFFKQFKSSNPNKESPTTAPSLRETDTEPQQDATEKEPASRTLKIEEDGDRWSGIKPKIRLRGYWLERAGFKPGSRVSVNCIAPGVMELRSNDDLIGGAK